MATTILYSPITSGFAVFLGKCLKSMAELLETLILESERPVFEY